MYIVLRFRFYSLEYGMTLRNFHDAISEADGARILRQWKFFVRYFRADGPPSQKDALEKFVVFIVVFMNGCIVIYVLFQY